MVTYVEGPRLTRAVLLLVAAIVLLGLGAFLALVWRDRTATLEAAGAARSQLVTLMEEQVRAAIDADGVALTRLERLVRRRGVADLSDTPANQAILTAIMAELPAIQSLLIIGPDGRLVLSSQEPPEDDSRYRGDRDYFLQVAPPATRRDFISPMIQGRMTGRFLFATSRRVEDESGHFLGVVQASIDVDYFVRLYRRLAVGTDETFSVYKTDGTIVLRHPAPPRGIVSVPEARFLSATSPPSGVYVGTSLFDGVERLHAFHILAEKGLVVTSSQPLETVLEGWRHRTWRTAGLMGGALAVLLALSAWAWQAARRAEDSARREAAANLSKSTFFASASHDLRQPMQAMRLFWLVIEARAEALDDAPLRRAVGRLDTAMRSGEELLDALLDVATLEAGRMTPRLQDFDLAEIIAAEAESFGGLATSRSLRLIVRCPPIMVRSDPVLLRRILRNLLVNAIKFTERGGVLIVGRRRRRHVTLQVWDSGKGIAESEMTAIFDDFYQIDNPARTRAEGLGLGLSVVSRTAHLLGHPLRARSRLGRGSVFEIDVPMGAA